MLIWLRKSRWYLGKLMDKVNNWPYLSFKIECTFGPDPQLAALCTWSIYILTILLC